MRSLVEARGRRCGDRRPPADAGRPSDRRPRRELRRHGAERLAPRGAARGAARRASISFVSPCVVPLVPGYLGYVSSWRARARRAWRRGRGWCWACCSFVLGFTAVFVVLGVAFASLGARVERPTRHHHPRARACSWWSWASCSSARCRSCSASGAFTCRPRPACGAPRCSASSSALAGPPASAPRLAAVLTLSLSEATATRGVILAVVYSLGLGLPFIALAVWMERSRAVLGWLRRHRLALMRIGGGVLDRAGPPAGDGPVGADHRTRCRAGSTASGWRYEPTARRRSRAPPEQPKRFSVDNYAYPRRRGWACGAGSAGAGGRSRRCASRSCCCCCWASPRSPARCCRSGRRDAAKTQSFIDNNPASGGRCSTGSACSTSSARRGSPRSTCCCSCRSSAASFRARSRTARRPARPSRGPAFARPLRRPARGLLAAVARRRRGRLAQWWHGARGVGLARLWATACASTSAPRATARRQVAVALEQGACANGATCCSTRRSWGCCVAIAFGSAYTYRGQAILVEGQTFTNAAVAYDSFEAGRLFDPAWLDPFTLRSTSSIPCSTSTGRPVSFHGAT